MTVKDIRNITAVALSIKRGYMDKLISGEKAVEIRKTQPVRLLGELEEGRAVVAYLIPSGSKCVEGVAAFGFFERFGTDSAGFASIARRACLNADDLRTYLGQGIGHAWHLLHPAERFVRPIPLSLTGIHHAPQSWQYIDRNSEFCIAMENLRNKKETQQ